MTDFRALIDEARAEIQFEILLTKVQRERLLSLCDALEQVIQERDSARMAPLSDSSEWIEITDRLVAAEAECVRLRAALAAITDAPPLSHVQMAAIHQARALLSEGDTK